MRLRATWWLLLAFVAASAFGAEKAHQHGKGRLDLAIEGSLLTLEFEAPLDDLVGFEREPRNDGERGALSALEAYLKSGRAFVPAAAAGCKAPTAAVAVSPPSQGHAEVRATWKYECADALRLATLDAAIFGQYPRLARIDVRAVTSKGQSAARLTASSRTLKL